MNSSQPQKNTALHLASGAIAGFATTALLHPLDSIKVRFQAQEGATGWRAGTIPGYRSTLGALKHITETEGFRSLYLGISPALVANAASWGLYFYFYEESKSAIYSRFKDAGTYGTIVAGVAAGMCTVMITNPMWLIKTRMQLEQSSHRRYVGLIPSLFKIVHEEGFVGLYRGIVPALFLTTHGAVQFAIYENMKRINETRRHGIKGEAHEFLVMGGVSKVFATVATYPAQVVKTRMQQRKFDSSSSYARTLSTIFTILSKEKMSGLYKGLGPTLWRVAPQSAIMLAAYEEVYKVLSSQYAMPVV
jgi:solute carrier family 25 (mitochondrial folate transporter), member 32